MAIACEKFICCRKYLPNQVLYFHLEVNQHLGSKAATVNFFPLGVNAE